MFLQKKISFKIAKMAFLIAPFLGFINKSLAYNYDSTLSLNQYLEQVKKNNWAFKGSKKAFEGANQRAGEGRLAMNPALFAEGQYLKNANDTTWSPFEGGQSQLQSYKMGISQDTPFGLQGQLYYNYQNQSVSGVSPTVLPQDRFVSSSPVVEFSFPLGRNWIGRETRASAMLVESQARLAKYSELFKLNMIMADAETAYWRLALANQVVKIQRESIERAGKIKGWVSQRHQYRLAENADLLQAEAAIDSRELDLQTAIDQQRLAMHTFNTLRGRPFDDTVPEHLIQFGSRLPETLWIPNDWRPRANVRAAEQQEQIAAANARIGIEKNKPNFDVYASYALSGKSSVSNEAVAQSFSWDYPSKAVGIRLKMPFDQWTSSNVRAGYRKEIRGAEYQYKQRVYEDHQLWDELTMRLERAQKRLYIAAKLEKVQFAKLNLERRRHSVGRTTTYQVLTFEQDYANAQISRLLVEAEILQLVAQMKTFGAI